MHTSFIVKLSLSLSFLALTACQTTGGTKETPEQILFSGVAAEKIDSGAKLSAENPTCLAFYSNTTRYISQPNGGKVAKGFAKTLALGVLSGTAAGGVGAIGISSSFVELALAGAANQVVYQGGEAALDKATGDADALTPTEEIEDAAARIGCPPPSKAAMKGAKKAAKAAKKKDEE